MSVGWFLSNHFQDWEGDDDNRSDDAVADDTDELDDEVLGVVVNADEEAQDEEDQQGQLGESEHNVANLQGK